MTEIARIDQAQVLPAADMPTLITPMAMIDRAVSSGASVEMLERLMAMQERWEANNARKAFDHAIAAAKAEMPVIVKGQTANRGNAGSYKYEDLAQIAAQIDPVLSKFGLSYRFRTDTEGSKVRVTCVVSHRDGHSETTALESGLDTSGSKNAIQAMGSAVSYLQRYTLKAALGLAAAKDDDANAAGGNRQQPAQRQDQRRPAPPALINADQYQELVALMDEAGVAEATILSHFQADALEELTVDQFAAATKKLRATIAQATARRQQDQQPRHDGPDYGGVDY